MLRGSKPLSLSSSVLTQRTQNSSFSNLVRSQCNTSVKVLFFSVKKRSRPLFFPGLLPNINFKLKGGSKINDATHVLSRLNISDYDVGFTHEERTADLQQASAAGRAHKATHTHF